MTQVLLDTNTYLRLARRIRPLLGVAFGQRGYVLTVLPDVEEEVFRSRRLRFLFPWFETDGAAEAERLAQRVRLSKAEREDVDVAANFLHDWVVEQALRFTTRGRTPPSPVDCRMLAFAQMRGAIVATDDLGMLDLAAEFEIAVWHGHELLAKLRTAKAVDNQLVREIFQALEDNGDLPASWREARHRDFAKVFGPQKG